MASHHEPLQALGPIDWEDVPLDSLKPFLDETFADAQTVIESIPSPTPTTALAAPIGRARAKTDSAVLFNDVHKLQSTQLQSAASLATAQLLRKEWKEIKVNARDNPLNISIYKLGAKDGRGAWFARRSIHEGLTFEAWRAGLEKEFPETMKVQGSPGSGNIRGIGADRNVESLQVEGSGHLNVFQLSAQFPGPTSPRDFITLLLTADLPYKPAGRFKPLRQYLIVSKPCNHAECPQRQGIIRGQYESVELVREVPLENDVAPARRSFSSADLGAEDRRTSMDNREDRRIAIEWLMVTRSDPGGSVPRFLVEKGTPPGIVGDAGKFLNWITANAADNSPSAEESLSEREFSSERDGGPSEEAHSDHTQNKFQLPVPAIRTPTQIYSTQADEEVVPSSNGIYGIISGVFGVASSVLATGLQQFSSPAASNTSQDDLYGRDDDYDVNTKEEEGDEQAEAAEKPEAHNDTDLSDTSSLHSFTSALERSVTEENRARSIAESNSDESKLHGNQSLEKELRKLQERRRKLDEKAIQMQERVESKRRGGKDKDDASITKMREKHDKEIAKQEAKYRRELQKLEEKREQEERKAEIRRRKAAEREERLSLTLELEKTRTERDVALKRLEILQSQVGELQAQNTMLVAKLGRMGGFDRTDSLSSSKGSGIGSPKST